MKKKIKKYPKTYEDVHTSERSLKRCKLDKVGTDIGLSADDYCKLIKKTFLDFQGMVFDNLVKTIWLMKRFCYDGIPRKMMRGNGWIDFTFGVFMRHHAGVENRLITRDHVYSKIVSYFEDFFPDFDALNPFEQKFEYPYKNVSFEYLIVVYQMEERLEFLQEAEDKKMGYTEFLDYIINYINCYNEEVGSDYYIFVYSHSFVPYVRVKDYNWNKHLSPKHKD